MGQSISAYIVVGALVKDLDIEKMPEYDGYLEVHHDPGSWRTLCNDYYYSHENSDLRDLTYVGMHHNWPDDDQQCVGYIVRKTDDWSVLEIDDMLEFTNDINQAGKRFKKLMGQWGNVILIPKRTT